MNEMIKTSIKPIKSIAKELMMKLPSAIVLMFHHITGLPEYQKSGCLLATDYFYDILNNLNDYMSCEDLLKCRPKYFRNKVVITFDDGLADMYSIAYPYLKNRQIPFTVFIINNFLDTEGYITTEQLIELSKNPLVTIGAHGVSHDLLPGMSSEQKWFEISQSKIKLEKLINKNIKLFAYSHGQYDNECIHMVKKAGYAGGFGVRNFPINFFSKKWKYYLPRYNVVDDGIENIYKIIYSYLHQ